MNRLRLKHNRNTFSFVDIKTGLTVAKMPRHYLIEATMMINLWNNELNRQIEERKRSG